MIYKYSQRRAKINRRRGREMRGGCQGGDEGDILRCRAMWNKPTVSMICSGGT